MAHLPTRCRLRHGTGLQSLDGAGGREAAGRWNNSGNAILYAAAHPSLAVLESLANLQHPARFGERTILEIGLDDDVEEVSLESVLRLREDAPADNPEMYTREFGSAWLKEQRTRGLVAPSFVLPYDRNVLINPRHPRAKSLKIVRSASVRLDQRLL